MTDGAYERPAIAGSGVIACGLAASASAAGRVQRWRAATRRRGAPRAGAIAGGKGVQWRSGRGAGDDGRQRPRRLRPRRRGDRRGPRREAGVPRRAGDGRRGRRPRDHDIVAERLRAGGRQRAPERLFGLHVFNPVQKMELVELCLPEGLRSGVGERARAWCQALGKTAVVVPDQAGFVVNRLLFPYLFDAVRMLERTELQPDDVDTCMTMGAGHPMGPLKLLDFVGLDVAVAIGDGLHRDSGAADPRLPSCSRRLVADGKLGRKSGAGFYGTEPPGTARCARTSRVWFRPCANAPCPLRRAFVRTKDFAGSGRPAQIPDHVGLRHPLALRGAGDLTPGARPRSARPSGPGRVPGESAGAPGRGAPARGAAPSGPRAAYR